MALEAVVCHLAHAFVVALGVTSHQNARCSGLADAFVVALGVMSRQHGI